LNHIETLTKALRCHNQNSS